MMGSEGRRKNDITYRYYGALGKAKTRQGEVCPLGMWVLRQIGEISFR